MLASALLSLAVAVAAAPEPVTLKVDVTKGGELRWSDEPCRLEARSATGEVIATDERGDSVDVPPGAVDIVVACTAKEGVVRRSQHVQAKKNETLKFALAPATIVATIERDGTKSAGTVVVFDGNNIEVARGADRTAIPVDAGKVRVVALVDRGGKYPIRGEQNLTIKAGQKSEFVVDASDGELVVSVTDNGRPAPAVIALREPGQQNRVLEVVANTPTAVPSGTWDIVTQLENSHDFREQLTRGVVVTPKKTTNRTIAHSTGTITPQTTPATGVLVELLHPGADVAFNQLEAGVPARLSPGRYVVRATGDTVLEDGAKPTVTITQAVSANSATTLKLQPQTATVDVEVRVGGEPAALPVALTLPAAAAAFITKTTDAAGKTSFAVAPQELVVSTTLTTAHGPLVQQKTLKLVGGQNRIRLDFNVGTSVVQVMEGGTAVVADVAYFAKLKGGVPVGEPIVAVKAGEAARLPPGIYTVAVTRGGQQRVIGEAKVAAGRTVERAIDWSAPATPAAAPR
jgi:hypothetical protein